MGKSRCLSSFLYIINRYKDLEGEEWDDGELEMALKIEYTAYDLYRNLAHQLSESENSEVFLSIAQAEKGHMRALIDAIEDCPP